MIELVVVIGSLEGGSGDKLADTEKVGFEVGAFSGVIVGIVAGVGGVVLTGHASINTGGGHREVTS